MKKNLLSLLVLGMFVSTLAFAQETIVGWTFEDENDTEFAPNLGLEINDSYKLYAEILSLGWQQGQRDITITEGYEGFAAQAAEWNDGAEDRVWSIRFDAPNFSNMTFSSRQFSELEGPKNWKIQMRVSGGSWTDLPDSEYTVEDNWETGHIQNFEIPAEYNNPSASLFIRWMMTDNEAVNGSVVTETAFSKIDNIIVVGNDISGVKQEIFNSNIAIYPNPCSEYFIAESGIMVSQLNIYDVQGKLVFKKSESFTGQQIIPINDLNKGVYFVEFVFENGISNYRERIIIK